MTKIGSILPLLGFLFLQSSVNAEIVSTTDSSVSASSFTAGFTPNGALDGDRFSAQPSHAWQGGPGQGEWWWECRFPAPRQVGAIFQIVGDHSFVFRNAPLAYVWQWSPDGTQWNNLPSTAQGHERRTFRILRLPESIRALGMRLQITADGGEGPAIREVEFYSNPNDVLSFPEWIVSVNTTDQSAVPSHGQEFIPLARSCVGWQELQAQQIWLGDFVAEFVSVEPRPFCAFLSGNFKDWCQIAREPWRGTQEILQKRALPIWASCGGAQGLAIPADVGVDRPWDCPHCRDSQAPKSPIYNHIGHTEKRPCGDYTGCVFERGPHQIQRVKNDPVFEGLPDQFTAMESHCGQIEWPPQGWELIATAGPGSKTKTQCLRVQNFPIYAAQFHIEMEGTPEVSRTIMGNFLASARSWRESNRPTLAKAPTQLSGVRPERLMWHEVRLDNSGGLLSWIHNDSPYDRVIRSAWNAFKQIPVQPDGFRTYFTHPTFYGPNDPQHTEFSGRWWCHNPASLFAMLTDSALLYYAYSGDREVLDRVREMLDHHIKHGSTELSDSWSAVPYACSDAGALEYRGATDTRYCFQENHTPCGRGDGVGYLEPDKVGELGHAYLLFYKLTLENQYLEAALRCANALAQHVRQGDESRSPWPFRVDAKTGRQVREEYSANTIGPIRLLDELLRLGVGETNAYQQTRDTAWKWLLQFPMQNQVWTQYFEDVLIYSDYRTNRNQYSPLETVRYLLQHPNSAPDSRAKAKAILDWVTDFFAADSLTMAGLPEKGRQWGAEVISEQVNDMDKMSSHTARYASVLALWSEVTGDASAKVRAFRSFNWATYSARTNGLVKTSLDEGTGYWFSDGYGDYMRHFQRGMASVPEWAPANEDHLLGSSSVVRQIQYEPHRIQYITFDPVAREILRLRRSPIKVTCAGVEFPKVAKLRDSTQGYEETPAPGGGVIIRIYHNASGAISLEW